MSNVINDVRLVFGDVRKSNLEAKECLKDLTIVGARGAKNKTQFVTAVSDCAFPP